MMQIQRLTEDSSWHLQWEALSMIIDPWLVGSEVDGTRLINEQWHAVDPVPIDELPAYDFIMVSQSYEDHCHLETLKLLDSTKDILATPKAYKKLTSHFSERKIIEIPLEGSISYGGFEFSGYRPKKWLDPIYYAVMIKDPHGNGIFYSPHGFDLQPHQLSSIAAIDVKLLVTTFTEFDLPALLGGKVNPGLNNVYQLNEQLQPDRIINTHDEEKLMKGLVARNARINYADYQSLEADSKLNFQYIKGYQPVSLP